MMNIQQKDSIKNNAAQNILLIFIAIIVAAGLMLVIALYAPSSLLVHTDFSAIYYADIALVHRIPVYDIPAIEAFVLKNDEELAGIFFLPRFPYPPWYMLTTFYLGLLPIEAAGTLWFEINLVMLVLSIWLFTDGWMPRARLLAFPLAMIFLPVLGTLAVGQYGFPVLLGSALLVFALCRENVLLATLGLALLTFKPHIGGLVFLITLFHLITRKDIFGWRVLKSGAWMGAFLFITGFIADPVWPVNYLKMLLTYQDQGNVITCSECAGAPIWLSRWFFDGSLSVSAGIAVILLITFILLFFAIRSWLMRSPSLFISFSLLATLLVSPYLYNYDFILLLIPLALFFQKENGILYRVIAFFCYLVPIPAIAFFGRDGNISFVIVTLILLLSFLQQARDIIKNA